MRNTVRHMCKYFSKVIQYQNQTTEVYRRKCFVERQIYRPVSARVTTHSRDKCLQLSRRFALRTICKRQVQVLFNPTPTKDNLVLTLPLDLFVPTIRWDLTIYKLQVKLVFRKVFLLALFMITTVVSISMFFISKTHWCLHFQHVSQVKIIDQRLKCKQPNQKSLYST